MTAKEALFRLKDCEIGKVGLLVSLQHIILHDLIKLEKIAGYIKNDGIVSELKIEIIKNIIKENVNEKSLLHSNTREV